MPDDAIPEPVEDQNNTGSLPVAENNERLRAFLRVAFAVCLSVVVMADVALYSLHQALHSRVEAQEHRIERLNKMLTDTLAANQNAEKIEKIGQQVTGIESQMDDLTTAIKAQDAEVPEPEPEKKGRR